MPGTPVEAVLSITSSLHLWAARPDAEGPLPVLVGLHGYAMSAPEMLPMLQRMAPTFLVVALQGPQSTIVPGTEATDRRIGYHWGVFPDPAETRALHRDCVAAAVRWAVENGGDPENVSLAAFSQPCSFNYRVALDPPHGRPFRSLVAICGGVPGNWTGEAPPPTEASRACAVLHISTREDPFYAPERVAGFAAVLERRFGSVAHHMLDGGHRIPSAAFEEIREFLLARASERQPAARKGE